LNPYLKRKFSFFKVPDKVFVEWCDQYENDCRKYRNEFYKTFGRHYVEGGSSVMLKLGFINMESGDKAIYVAEFNNGFSHIIVDDSCWVIVNGYDGEAKQSSWIFPEAKEALNKLPNSPLDYMPYIDFVNNNG
jgi:hypothetical protein